MEIKDSVFFGENGLTTTSAQHVKDMAGHYVDDLKQTLNAINFVDTTINIIGSDKPSPVNKGWNEDELNSVNTMLEIISQAQSLQSWLGEAINAKHNLQDKVMIYTLNDYCEDNNITLASVPAPVYLVTEDEWLSTLPIKERNRYLTLQTYCSVFGNFIHPKYKGNFHNAREQAMRVEKTRYDLKEDGRDTVIYDRTLSIDIDKINDKYYEIQAIHRDKQAEFNALKHQFEVYRDNKYAHDKTEYEKQLQVHKQQILELTSAWETKKEQLNQEIAQLKIVIPDALKSIFDKINKLGK